MTQPPAALQLPDRAGLPDEIAYLRAAYPAPQWRAHRNYGDLTAFWLQVHASLRAEAQRVAQTTQAFREGGGRIGRDAFQRAFVPGFNYFLQHLTGHHGIEDQAYFPKFRSLDPRMAAAFDVLESDHQIIHASLEATLDHARGLLAALGQPGDPRPALDRYADTSERLFGLLGQHLADEEDIVIPAMLEHGERRVS
jgi:iron-sulfur cluster repair protein YtfE (RIC family)